MTLKYKLLSGAAILGAVSLPAVANAVDNVTVNATITTAAGISASNVSNVGFGNWLIGISGAETPTITLGTTSGGYTVAGVTNSQIINLDGDTAGTVGQVTVDLPTGADNITLQMTRSAITDYTDAGLSLTAVSYDDDSSAPANLAAATPVDIIVEVGGTPEPVTFGATITADATPASAIHTASFNVAFSF
ncbi:MAG: hypothetical protein WBK77_05335 [Alphaproteobacteria bacterium]